jgi:hypothetical protein
MDALN